MDATISDSPRRREPKGEKESHEGREHREDQGRRGEYEVGNPGNQRASRINTNQKVGGTYSEYLPAQSERGPRETPRNMQKRQHCRVLIAKKTRGAK